MKNVIPMDIEPNMILEPKIVIIIILVTPRLEKWAD